METKNLKKLLIMGANPETVSLILKAKEMGIYTIVTDYDPHAYAKSFADEAANVDAVDVDGLTALAREKQVDGVAVGVAEALLPAYCDVCARLGFPAFSTKEKFERMSRKDLFKAACREYHVPTVREFSRDDPDSVEYPAIVKPVDSCSSKGIRVCHNRAELDAAMAYALGFSASGKVLIEEYMSGDEVIAYYVMQDGNPIFVGMCDRYTWRANHSLVQLPISYIFPSVYTDRFLETADRPFKAMIRGVGLENGSIFFQCFAGPDGVIRTYEAGYRLNGAQEHILISAVSGIDAKEMYLNYALTGRVADHDLEPLADPKPGKCCCKLSPLVRTGKIGKISGLEAIRSLPDVISVNPSYRDGDTVSGEGTLKQIAVRIFIVSENAEKLHRTIDAVNSLLSVTDPDGNEMLVRNQQTMGNEYDSRFCGERNSGTRCPGKRSENE